MLFYHRDTTSVELVDQRDTASVELVDQRDTASVEPVDQSEASASLGCLFITGIPASVELVL